MKVAIEVDAGIIPEMYGAMDRRAEELKRIEQFVGAPLKRDVHELYQRVNQVAGMLIEKVCELQSQGHLRKDAV